MEETFKFFFQHLPEQLDSVAFSVGSLDVRWYSIMYLVGFAVAYALLKWRIKNGEGINELEIKKQELSDLIVDLFSYGFIGLLIGARLGYVVFYDFAYFIKNPLEIILPVNFSCQWSNVNCHTLTGFYGMSYFGGLIGVLIAGYIFSKKRKVDFWKLADFVVPAIPAGYFFGRIGNFLNGELYGRITDWPWGMYFPADSLEALRHPSQLYEAFFEGLVLFVILWPIRNRSNVKGQLLFIYLLGYGIARFGCEFFREPDPQVGLIFGLTLGQIFSLVAVILAVHIFIWRRKKKVV